MARKQKKIIFQIGVPLETQPHRQNLLINRLTRAASGLCGGCTTMYQRGWWIEGAEIAAETFTGAVKEEGCLTIELTCELEKYERTLAQMKQMIAQTVTNTGVPADWVHVTVLDMTAEHFSIKELMA